MPTRGYKTVIWVSFWWLLINFESVALLKTSVEIKAIGAGIIVLIDQAVAVFYVKWIKVSDLGTYECFLITSVNFSANLPSCMV